MNNATSANKVIYVLYIIAIIFPITYIIGGICAYIYRDDATSPFEKSHITYQIRGFWQGLLFLFIALLFSAALLGLLVYIFFIIWALIRNIKGLKALSEQQPITDPTTWWF